MVIKKALGQYFTEKNIFQLTAFKEWAHFIDLKNKTILEPFAGSNNLIHMLQNEKLCSSFKSVDIDPKHIDVQYNDSFTNFPKDFEVCITNPPFAPKNQIASGAIQSSIKLQDGYEDLYQLALKLILENCKYAAVIVPASYLTSNRIGSNRLQSIILLEDKNIFQETAHPVCLALFCNELVTDFKIYSNDSYLGTFQQLKSYPFSKEIKIKINHKENKGNVCIHKIDGTTDKRIQFYKTKDFNDRGQDYRCLGKFQIDIEDSKLDFFIKKANEELNNYRNFSKDIELTPFKSLRKDGKFRRRIDCQRINYIINNTINKFF